VPVWTVRFWGPVIAVPVDDGPTLVSTAAARRPGLATTVAPCWWGIAAAGGCDDSDGLNDRQQQQQQQKQQTQQQQHQQRRQQQQHTDTDSDSDSKSIDSAESVPGAGDEPESAPRCREPPLVLSRIARIVISDDGAVTAIIAPAAGAARERRLPLEPMEEWQ
jgi:hemolysin activation/secretion protein